MRAEFIRFLDSQTRDRILIRWEDGNQLVESYPPTRQHLIDLIEDYGGRYEIERTTVDQDRELKRKMTMWEKFEEGHNVYQQSLHIDFITTEKIDKVDMMKIKMSMFRKEEVKNCKDRELLTGLRKADDIVDIMMYYGLIRRAANSSV